MIQLFHHFPDRSVPGLIMAEQGCTADNFGFRILFLQPFYKCLIMLSPLLWSLTVVVFFHVVIRMIIILTDCHNYHLRCIFGEIPLCCIPKQWIVMYFIPGCLHSDCFHSSFRQRIWIHDFCSLAKLKSQESKFMAGILSLENHHFMFRFLWSLYRNIQQCFSVFRKKNWTLFPIQDHSQIIVPISITVLHMNFQNVSCKFHFYKCTRKYKNRFQRITPVNSSTVNQFLMIC